MVLFVCFEARERDRDWDPGTRHNEVGTKSSLLERVYSFCSGKTSGLFLFHQLPKALSSSHSVFKFGFLLVHLYWDKRSSLAGGEKRGKKGLKKDKGKTQAKRGNQWDNLVVEAYPYWLYAVNLSLKNSSKRETYTFLSCIFKFASCVVSLL